MSKTMDEAQFLSKGIKPEGSLGWQHEAEIQARRVLILEEALAWIVDEGPGALTGEDAVMFWEWAKVALQSAEEVE